MMSQSDAMVAIEDALAIDMTQSQRIRVAEILDDLVFSEIKTVNQTKQDNERLCTSLKTLGLGQPDVLVSEMGAMQNKGGRPRAIPKNLIPIVIKLRCQGNGYGKIADILKDEYGLNPHRSTVRRYIENRKCEKR